jgi:hypothetical protein
MSKTNSKSRSTTQHDLKADRIKDLRTQHAAGLAPFSLHPDEKQPHIRNSPYNWGQYAFTLMALVVLGTDKRHSLPTFTAKLREIESESWTKDEDGKTEWQRFIHKEISKRNGKSVAEENALDTPAKILTNIEVLQRPDYGRKLLQYSQKVLGNKGGVILITKGATDADRMIELSTDEKVPVNEFKRARSGKPKATKVTKKATKKVARKNNKGTNKANAPVAPIAPIASNAAPAQPVAAAA